jgi:hypothetical protein
MTTDTAMSLLAEARKYIQHLDDCRILSLNGPCTCGVANYSSRITALQSIKDAGDDVVEPVDVAMLRSYASLGLGWGVDVKPNQIKSVADYIDTLLAKYKLACVQRDEFRKDAERWG